MRRLSVLCAAAFVVLTVLVMVRFGPLVSADTSVSEAAHRFALRHHGWRSAMSVVTHSADTRVLLPVAPLLAVLLLWRRWRTGLWFLAGVAVTATVVRIGVLTLVHRPRPENRLTATAGWAFPSGHTTSSAIVAGVLIVLGCAAVGGRWPRRALVAGAGTWAALVGVSRVALLAHWPSDVIGGWLLATAVTAGFGFRIQRSFRTGRPASPQRDEGRKLRPEGNRPWNTALPSSPPVSEPGTTAPPPN